MFDRLPPATVLALALLLLGGCSTKRTLTIHSEPPGATIWVDGEQRGQTPYTIPFVYYGTFDIRLEKSGYESFAREVLVPTKIDGYPIIDLPFELTVRGRHFAWTTTLQPLSAQPSEAELRTFLGTARAFRQEAREKTDPANLPDFGREKVPFDPVSPGSPPAALPRAAASPGRACAPPCPPRPCVPPPPPPPPAPRPRPPSNR